MTTFLVTGISGEVGSSLAAALAKDSTHTVIGFDRREPSPATARDCKAVVLGDISDNSVIKALESEYQFDTIFHLAGVLSSGGERDPLLAHKVNVTGTLNLLELARAQSEKRTQPVKFIFTSTIAV
jgi:threonine 3-dehydrogenase